MDSRSCLWAALTDGEIHVGNTLGNGCDRRKAKVLERAACTFPWFLIHPSVLFQCTSGAGSLHL